MKSTPHTHTGKTKAEMTVEFGPTGCPKQTITVPAGIRCIKLDGGSSPWVVDDLSFIADKGSILYHDADHYGIRLSEDQLTDIQPKGQPRPKASSTGLSM